MLVWMRDRTVLRPSVRANGIGIMGGGSLSICIPGDGAQQIGGLSGSSSGVQRARNLAHRGHFSACGSNGEAHVSPYRQLSRIVPVPSNTGPIVAPAATIVLWMVLLYFCNAPKALLMCGEKNENSQPCPPLGEGPPTSA